MLHYFSPHQADARPRVQSTPRKSPLRLVLWQKIQQFPQHLCKGKHIAHIDHVQPISCSNEGRCYSGKKKKKAWSEPLKSEIIQGKVVQHNIFLLGVVIREKKQHCFHLELVELQIAWDSTRLRGETVGYFLSLDFGVDFV